MTYFQVVRLLHYYGYTHVQPRRHVTMGEGATLAPNVSLRNGERISIGARSKVGERAYLWAGDTSGRITIGENCRLGPEVFVTASDYGLAPDETIAEQARNERDVVIGNDVWLGARVFVARRRDDRRRLRRERRVRSSRKSLPPGSIAVGIPARIVRRREDYAGREEDRPRQADEAQVEARA